MSLTIFGGHGFVGSHYVDRFYHHAIGNIASVNERSDYEAHSQDALYFISTVHNYHVFTNPHLDIDTNLTTLINVLESWKKYQETTGKKGTFNFVSSWSVYGNQGHNVKEDSPCDPKGFYIITKRCAEQLLMSYCETFGISYRILRLPNVIGTGDNKVSDKKNTLQNAFNKLRRNENVELFGDGLFYRDFMHVEDCARAIDLIVEKGNVNCIYNVGNGNTQGHLMYYRDILDFAKNVLGSTGTVVYTKPTEFQSKVPVSSFYMNVDKLKGLGFKPRYLGPELFMVVILEK